LTKADIQEPNHDWPDLTDRSALVVIVSAIIQGPRWTVRSGGGAFQYVIWNVQNQNILIDADVIIFVHMEPPYLHVAIKMIEPQLISER
jgi:hypothetical protein